MCQLNYQYFLHFCFVYSTYLLSKLYLFFSKISMHLKVALILDLTLVVAFLCVLSCLQLLHFQNFMNALNFYIKTKLYSNLLQNSKALFSKLQNLFFLQIFFFLSSISKYESIFFSSTYLQVNLENGSVYIISRICCLMR